MTTSKEGPLAERSPKTRFAVIASLTTMALTLGGVALSWPLWLAYLVAINTITLLFYAYDKLTAGHQKRTRVPEIVLHALAFAGGSPVALVSQWLFRHKTAKASFVLVYWVIVLAQGALVGWWWSRSSG